MVYTITEKGVDFFDIPICERLMGERYPDFIGDDTCDDVANNRFCNYDGGDCCSLYKKRNPDETGKDKGKYAKNSLRCVPPHCNCHITGKEANDQDGFMDNFLKFCSVRSLSMIESDVESDDKVIYDNTNIEVLGNGVCSPWLNISDCAYDLGDCIDHVEPCIQLCNVYEGQSKF